MNRPKETLNLPFFVDLFCNRQYILTEYLSCFVFYLDVPVWLYATFAHTEYADRELIN